MILIKDAEFEKLVATTLNIKTPFVGSICYKGKDGFGGNAYFLDKQNRLNLVSCGSGKWITKDNINEFVNYPFDYLSATTIYAYILPSNIRSINITNRFFGSKKRYRNYIEYTFTRQSLRMFKLHGLDNAWLRKAGKKTLRK